MLDLADLSQAYSTVRQAGAERQMRVAAEARALRESTEVCALGGRRPSCTAHDDLVVSNILT